jgi:hypothetical protein
MQLQVKTLLNAIQHFPGFVYKDIRLNRQRDGSPREVVVTVEAHSSMPAKCSRCQRVAPGYDRLPERPWLFVPLWGIITWFRYAPRRVHSIARWQTESPALLWFWIPAVFFWGWSWNRRRGKSPTGGSQPASGLAWHEIGLRWLAAVLAIWATTETALHLVPRHFLVNDKTLAVARRFSVPPKERADFEALASRPIWQTCAVCRFRERRNSVIVTGSTFPAGTLPDPGLAVNARSFMLNISGCFGPGRQAPNDG